MADDAAGQLLRAGVLYRGGFGERPLLERLVADVSGYSRNKPLGDVQIVWSSPTRTAPGATVRRGHFRSPSPVPLPEEARSAAVELWRPSTLASNAYSGPACLLLASTGDEGFSHRRQLAQRLIEGGVGSLILENPFYGSRRPRGQRGPALRTVSDQFAMNLATVDEARALLGWMRDQGFGPVGVTGYSQGGFMSAFAAALVDFPVVAIPRGAGTSAVPVFTRSVLSRGIRWSALAREEGTEALARKAMVRYLEAVDLLRHPSPVAPELATILVPRHDRFVPPDDGLALHRYWAGSNLVWSETGHLTSLVLDGREHVRAIVNAFARAAKR